MDWQSLNKKHLVLSFTLLLVIGGGILVILESTNATANLDRPHFVYAATSNPSASADEITSIAVDSSYVYAAGYDGSPGNYEWRIEKRNLSDGSLVYATTSNPSASSDEVTTIAIDSSYMYIAGFDSSPGNKEWRIEKRRLSDGSLVYAVTSNPSASADEITTMKVDSSYMYAAGYDSASGNEEWRVEKRRLSDGSLVYAITSNPSISRDEAKAIRVDSSYMYVAGFDSAPGNEEWRIEKRRLSDGSLVYATTSNPSVSLDEAKAIAIDSSYMYVAGFDSALGNEEWRIEKRNLSDGSLVYATVSDPSISSDAAKSIAVNSSNMYVAGYDSAPGNYEWRIEKRNLSDGSLEYAMTSNPSVSFDGIKSIAINSSNIYAAGYDSSPGNEEWRIEKY